MFQWIGKMFTRRDVTPLDTAPSVHAVTHALRHRETWPKSFYWTYRSMCGCAMGLAHATWPASFPFPDRMNASDHVALWARLFDVPPDMMWPVLMERSHYESRYGVTSDQITPDAVADELDKLLAWRQGL